MARVSGWASPSSPARAAAAPPRLPSPPCSDLAATATAADPRPWPRSRGGGRRGTASCWNRRIGAQGLPRGVVETSSDRFLRSLWDSTSKHADTKIHQETPKHFISNEIIQCFISSIQTGAICSIATRKVDVCSIIQVTDNNQLTSSYCSQPGWGDDMATFQMTIAANNLNGDYQLANGYRPVQAKAVLTEYRQNTIPEMRTTLVASKSAGPYLIALCLYMIAARFF